jgi:NAD(P)-dependent dehydrogenase (short-subunit alcohol dehydrogenase family)
MGSRLAGKVAIVTGGGAGIGAAIALGFIDEGALVCIADKDSKGARETAKRAQNKGGKAIAIRTDVSKQENVRTMVSKTLTVFGQIDILVNNAGIAIYAPFLTYPIKDWKKTLDVNLTGYFICAQEVAKDMLKRHSGKIINISSITAVLAMPNSVAYTSTKAAISGFTRALALELAPHGITVNAIGPGAIMTSMAKKALKKADIEAREAMIPIGRYGIPRDLIEPAVFLASSGSDYVTGQSIYVDGGYLISGVPRR